MNYEAITTCDVANGEGLGVVLWVSGCDIYCPGCHNKETWDPNTGSAFTELQEKLILKELERPEITRFTLSGGHPLMPCNREDVKNLICKVRDKFKDKIKIWLYTGYIYDRHYMDKDVKSICDMCDVVVDGPYIEKLRDINLKFKGSSNQRIIRIKS